MSERRGTAQGRSSFSCEKLAYWFFRLNGCFTIENFVVHPDLGGGQRTDADILGVRFPHRKEGLADSMVDHEAVLSERPLIFAAEVKLRKCELNGPWTRPEDRELERVLTAFGLWPIEETSSIADAIYIDGSYRDSRGEFRLYAMGDVRDSALARRHRDVRQLLWNDVLTFVHQRFTRHGAVKRDHQQWDEVGWSLYEKAQELSGDAFVRWGRASLTDGRGRFLE